MLMLYHKNLSTEKETPGFNGEFCQTYKVEMVPILRVLQETEEENSS